MPNLHNLRARAGNSTRSFSIDAGPGSRPPTVGHASGSNNLLGPGSSTALWPRSGVDGTWSRELSTVKDEVRAWWGL